MQAAEIERILREVLHCLRRAAAERRDCRVVQINQIPGDGELIATGAQLTPPINVFIGRSRKTSSNPATMQKAATMPNNSGSGNDS